MSMRSEVRVLRRSFRNLSRLCVPFAALVAAGCNVLLGIDAHELLVADDDAAAHPAEAGPDSEPEEAAPAMGDDRAVPDTGAEAAQAEAEAEAEAEAACTGACSPGSDAASEAASVVDASDDSAADGGARDAAGEAGPTCSAQAGKSCGSCGGVYGCNGSCSVATPLNFGQSCGSCGGVYGCNGACTVATPSNYGQTCGSCGGKVQCNSACSVATPTNYGQSCNGGCSYINCSGNCNAPGGGPTYGGSCPTSSGTAIAINTTYGNYDVQSITLNGAPPGVYTFTIVSGDAGLVTLLRDGTAVTTLNYNWQTTVSGMNVNPILSFTFNFAGYLSINVRGGSQIPNGTLNLYDLNANSIFDGAHYISICCN
jgi:hypothetical protein